MISSVSPDVLSKRIKKVLELRLETDKDTLDALNQLTTFFHENRAENRRNLLSSIEQRSLDINGQFLDSLAKVNGTLDTIYKDATHMDSVLSEMTTELQQTKSKTQSLINETTQLQRAMKVVNEKNQITDAFIERFQLKDTEVAALWSNAVGPEIFAALERAEEIHSSCRLLMQPDGQPMPIAAHIMQQMKTYQNVGMERVFRWAQTRCRTMEAPDPCGLLPLAVAKLHERPELFNQLLEEYTTNRRDILVRHFIDALTRGGRPIELRATEPSRYIGDMLAWLHQAVPAEKDHLSYMLRNCENLDIGETTQAALGSINEGVCHPLRVRIEHILLSEENARNPILLHGILNLLRYYKDTIFQVVGAGQLDSTLGEVMSIAEKTFLLGLQNRVALLLGTSVTGASKELTPSPAVGKALALLGQLLSADSAADGRLAHVAQMVACVMDSLIQQVTEDAAKLPPADMAVFLLNCFHAMQVALALFPFLDDRLERIKAMSDAQLDTLIQEQASSLVAHLGLNAIYTLLQGAPQKPLGRLPALDPANISAFALKLEKFISTPDLYHLPPLVLLTSNNHRVAVVKRAGAVVADIYKDLHKAVHDPENEFVAPDKLLPLPPDAVTAKLTT